MSREIKFRQVIRDTEGNFKHWHYWGYLGDKWHGCTLPLGPVEWDERESYQYTGLKDKNGKEIYDGDIVYVEEGNFEVCFLENCWYLRRKFSGGISFGRLNETWIEAAKKNLPYEVIGNIYEDSHLLGE